MNIELPQLPYALNELEPFISQTTLECHYGKDHQAYIDNLKKILSGSKYEDVSLEIIIKEADGSIFNNGAQIWNHTFYFMQFGLKGAKTPQVALAKAIDDTFGSFELFKEQFTKAGTTLFGSGWAWLVKDSNNTLSIVQKSNAGNPLRGDLTPILTLDVWEHAYYLDTQNARPKYIQNFWEALDWTSISSRF